MYKFQVEAGQRGVIVYESIIPSSSPRKAVGIAVDDLKSTAAQGVWGGYQDDIEALSEWMEANAGAVANLVAEGAIGFQIPNHIAFRFIRR